MLKFVVGFLLGCMFGCSTAHAQGYGGGSAEWPKPGPTHDWVEWVSGPPPDLYMNRRPSPDQPGAQPHKGFPLFNPDGSKNEINTWMSELQRPDDGGSCCGPADAYPVEVLQEGCYIDDKCRDQWVVSITDGSPVKYPDGTERPSLPNGTIFHVMPNHVNRAKDGNPLRTAIMYVNVYGEHEFTIYCLVPLPPAF